MNVEQKNKLRALRIARDASTDPKATASIMAKIASLEAKVSQVVINDKGGAIAGATENDQDAGNSNRGHDALKKPKRAGNKSGRDSAVSFEQVEG